MAETLVSMYPLKPVEDPGSVFHYNSSMYPLKSLVDPSLSLETGRANEGDEVYEEVERTQAVILEYIRAIKKQVEELKQILLKRRSPSAETKQVSNEMSLEPSLVKSGVTHELVINADIDNPPYSLLVLHHLTKRVISLRIASHNHSSVSKLPQHLEKFKNISCNSVDGNQVLKVRLIWKKGGGTSVVVGHVPLCGEVSLLRFVHTCLNVKLDPSQDTQLQRILDDVNNKGNAPFETSVKDARHLVADRLTVADIALWSQLKRTPTGKLQQWYKHFDKILSQ